MLIGEVCKLTGLSKKAISYYEQQGLIKPIRGVNKYREYSKLDVELLNKISLYRSLDICISDIKIIINNKNKKEIILENKYKKELALKKQIEYLQEINKSLSKNDIEEKQYKDSIKVDFNYDEVRNISVNSENTKEVLRICLSYINKSGKLDELLIITQYSASDLIELLNEGIMPARLANYILDSINIDIKVLLGIRELTELEKISLIGKE
ncbi:MerR family transcriptional regulator [Clostridium perfringens]|uniref:MerR family transcriptional regulator n=1 Tax=Clostridium perfringens TaxID=1502 RepID=UPI003BAC453F